MKPFQLVILSEAKNLSPTKSSIFNLQSLTGNRPSSMVYGLSSFHHLVILSTAKNLLLFIIIATALSSCKPTKDNRLDKYDRGTMLSATYTNVIEPATISFKTEATNLNDAAQAFAQAPSLSTLTALQQQWVATQNAWQPCEAMNMGSIEESFIQNSINKWATNTTFIENFISGTDVLNEAFIEGAGSTSKGLPAIEYLIYGTDNNTVLQTLTTGTNAARRMQYLTALTANLNTKAAALLAMWQAYQNTFTTQTGLAIDGSANILVNALIVEEEFVRNNKIGKPLGKYTGGTAQPSEVESPISQTSLQHIVRNLDGINALLNGNLQGTQGNGLYTYIDAVDPMADGVKLSDKIKGQMQLCYTAAANVNGSLKTAVVNNPQQVDALWIELKKLTVLLKVDMTGVLGVTVTFSDNDGD